jgi:hypothetical protein
MDGFVDRLQALRFLHACDPSYRALTFTLVGLPPTGYISLLLDILFGSFLPSLGLVGTTKFTQVDGADIVMKSILVGGYGFFFSFLILSSADQSQ